MRLKFKYVFGSISILILIFFIVLLFTNSLRVIGVCRPGMKFVEIPPGNKQCYKPSGYAGKPCSKLDCGGAHCKLINPDGKYVGECRDITAGCHVWVDEEGNYPEGKEKEIRCTD